MEAPTGALELENTDNNLRFIDTQYSSSDTDPFDDMLIALDPDHILRPLAKDGSIPSALAVTMDRLNLIRQVLVSQIVSENGLVPGVLPGIPPLSNPPQDGWGTAVDYDQQTEDVCSASAGPTSFKLTSSGVDRVPRGQRQYRPK